MSWCERWTRRLGWAVLAVAVAACSEPVAPDIVSAPPAPELAVEQEWIDLTGAVFWNGCTEEYVGFEEGSVRHEIVRVEDDGQGGFHVRFHANGRNYHGPGLAWTGSGFVPTGTEYRGNSVSNFTLNARPPFPWQGTVTSDVRVIQVGSGKDMRFHELVHVTVNAVGEIATAVVQGWFTCR